MCRKELVLPLSVQMWQRFAAFWLFFAALPFVCMALVIKKTLKRAKDVGKQVGTVTA
jgi:hypothetical protein